MRFVIQKKSSPSSSRKHNYRIWSSMKANIHEAPLELRVNSARKETYSSNLDNHKTISHTFIPSTRSTRPSRRLVWIIPNQQVVSGLRCDCCFPNLIFIPSFSTQTVLRGNPNETKTRTHYWEQAEKKHTHKKLQYQNRERERTRWDLCFLVKIYDRLFSGAFLAIVGRFNSVTTTMMAMMRDAASAWAISSFFFFCMYRQLDCFGRRHCNVFYVAW